jgi:putative membrane protein
MNIKKILYTCALIFTFGASGLSFAGDKIDKINADDFIDEVSAKGVAEIESATLALEKSTSTDIKAFAQKMITAHAASNVELAAIASRKNLEVADEAELTAKAKKVILEFRDGQSFDKAYADNQVEIHKSVIELYQRAAVSADVEIATYAKQNLPKLEEHLKKAKELAAAHDKK